MVPLWLSSNSCSRTQIVQPDAVRTSLDDALIHHCIDKIVVGLATLGHNRLIGIESNAHDASRDVFCPVGHGHRQIVEGDVTNAESIVEIVTRNSRIRGIICDAKAALIY